MTIDDWEKILTYASAGLVILTAFVGLPTIIVQYLSGQNKDKQLQELKQEVQIEGKKRAEAELKLQELQIKVSWRVIDEVKFEEILKSAPPAKAIIIFEDDNEAYLVATQIWTSLLRVGWTVDNPTLGQKTSAYSPFTMREGGIMASDLPKAVNISTSSEDMVDYDKQNTSLWALRHAFEACEITPLISSAEYLNLPQGTYRIVVAKRI